MDPLTLLKTLWRHKWVTLPFVMLTAIACVYVYTFAPRLYEANVSYALTAPKIPTDFQLESEPGLALLNSDNPYLRSNDSSLLTQVVITKLQDPAYVDQLEAEGFGTEFEIEPVAGLGMGLVTVSATSASEAEAVSTAKLVGERFTSTVYEVQKINGAADRYLYSPILVRGPGPAKEMYSNRLRSLIMVGIAGSVLLFGAVSIARSRRPSDPDDTLASTAETDQDNRQQGGADSAPVASKGRATPIGTPNAPHNPAPKQLVGSGKTGSIRK